MRIRALAHKSYKSCINISRLWSSPETTSSIINCRTFHTSFFTHKKKSGGGGGDDIQKVDLAKIRNHFKTEDEFQWHMARQMFLQRGLNYGRQGHRMQFLFYRTPNPKREIVIKSRSHYPTWLFLPATYERFTSDKIPQWAARAASGKLSEKELKRYKRTIRRFKMKLHLQHGKRAKGYTKTLMEGQYDFYV